jgi:hypothetical protein
MIVFGVIRFNLLFMNSQAHTILMKLDKIDFNGGMSGLFNVTLSFWMNFSNLRIN